MSNKTHLEYLAPLAAYLVSERIQVQLSGKEALSWHKAVASLAQLVTDLDSGTLVLVPATSAEAAKDSVIINE